MSENHENKKKPSGGSAKRPCTRNPTAKAKTKKRDAAEVNAVFPAPMAEDAAPCIPIAKAKSRKKNTPQSARGKVSADPQAFSVSSVLTEIGGHQAAESQRRQMEQIERQIEKNRVELKRIEEMMAADAAQRKRQQEELRALEDERRRQREELEEEQRRRREDEQKRLRDEDRRKRRLLADTQLSPVSAHSTSRYAAVITFDLYGHELHQLQYVCLN